MLESIRVAKGTHYLFIFPKNTFYCIVNNCFGDNFANLVALILLPIQGMIRIQMCYRNKSQTRPQNLPVSQLKMMQVLTCYNPMNGRRKLSAVGLDEN